MKKESIRNIMKVYAVGIMSALLSAAAACLVYMTYWLFCGIPAAGGYLAIVYFAAALASAAAALLMVYISGAWVVRTGKFSK